MTRQLYLAAGLFEEARLDPSLVPAQQAIRLATIEGARALLWDDEIGWILYNDPIQTLVYAVKGSSVKRSIINGALVMEKRRVLTLHEEEDKEQARRLTERVVARTGLKRGQIPITSSLYD